MLDRFSLQRSYSCKTFIIVMSVLLIFTTPACSQARSTLPGRCQPNSARSKPLVIAVDGGRLRIDGSVRTETLRSSIVTSARERWATRRIDSRLGVSICWTDSSEVGDLCRLFDVLSQIPPTMEVKVQWGGGGITLTGEAPKVLNPAMTAAAQAALPAGTKSILDVINYVSPSMTAQHDLEADFTKPEVSTLMEYVHALGGTLEIRVAVNDHTYIHQVE